MNTYHRLYELELEWSFVRITVTIEALSQKSRVETLDGHNKALKQDKELKRWIVTAKR